MRLDVDDQVAVRATEAIQNGDDAALRKLLAQHPQLVSARIGPQGNSRTLLHIATDWPGHFSEIAATVALLVEAGADVHARFDGTHTETPLHWAASSDDVEAIDALLAAGADLDATGGVIGDGTPLDDAVAFGQWDAARRLRERGATLSLPNAAALGEVAQVNDTVTADPPPTPEQLTVAFWNACHGGQRDTAQILLGRGAHLEWVGFDDLTPLDAARRSDAGDLADWLEGLGARSGEQLRDRDD